MEILKTEFLCRAASLPAREPLRSPVGSSGELSLLLFLSGEILDE